MEGEDRWLSLSLGTSMNPLAFQQYRRDPPSAESVTRIDVNRIPTWNTYHDDVSSRQSGKRQSSESEEEEEEEGENTRKKLRLSKEQSAVLEESFKEHTSLNPNEVETNRGGPRISETMLRKSNERKPKAPKRVVRTEGNETVTTFLHASSYYCPYHLPLMRETRVAEKIITSTLPEANPVVNHFL
ncbi:homeobox-leucine zipper protein HAT1-like isoform X2 [Tasmannia lanceolata]|uniref:homeobox-leucine zipper protein HAT1-like isoform X2 n=1 Tax=Tasmannia lanceolata TaxID=3420 RepID=UPI00406327D2